MVPLDVKHGDFCEGTLSDLEVHIDLISGGVGIRDHDVLATCECVGCSALAPCVSATDVLRLEAVHTVVTDVIVIGFTHGIDDTSAQESLSDRRFASTGDASEDVELRTGQNAKPSTVVP